MGKYEEALERAKAGKPLYEVFPELYESEDEKIRKWLVDYFVRIGKSWIHREFTCEQIVTYLEKQKEYVSENFDEIWNEEECSEIIDEGKKLTPKFKVLLKEICHAWYDRGIQVMQKEQKPNVELIQKSWYLDGYHDGKYNNEPKWLIQTGKGGPRYEENQKYGTQKPAEWSEEDEDYLIDVKSAVNDYFDEGYAEELCTWLKSLRPQPHWKPSKEQLNALHAFVGMIHPDARYDAVLSLLNDLQKIL